MMKFKISLFCLFCLLPFAGVAETPEPSAFLPLPNDLIPLDSARGKVLLSTSDSTALWPLAQYYITQPDLGSCGVASCVMVLNALPIPRPVSKAHGDFQLFTPANFFSPAVSAIRSREDVSKSGMTLDDLARILATYSVEIKLTHAQSGSVKDFRSALRDSLSHRNEYVLVNYLRKALGQNTGGHISPVGAYNREADRALILDVSNYKYPWVWVKVDALYRAMETVDDSSGLSRGYLLVKPRK